jgi:hypothetical protein
MTREEIMTKPEDDDKYDRDYLATIAEIERLLGRGVEILSLVYPESRRILADKLEKLGADKNLLKTLRR